VETAPKTSVSSSKGASKTDKGNVKSATEASKSLPTAPRLTGQAAFDAMQSSRRDEKVKSKREKSRTIPEDDFWAEMEGREAGFNEQKKAVPPKKTQDPESEYALEFERENKPQQQEQRRKSRFEIEEQRNDRQARKFKQRQQRLGGRGRRYDNYGEDWDDGDMDSLEEKRRRKEEKRLQKLREEEEAVPTPIFLPEFLSVSSLARSLKQRTQNFLYDLEEMGFENMTTDTLLTGETAALIAMEYGFDPTVDTGSQRDLRPRPIPEDLSTLPPRPPIVTIMGHVDHGKTTLLDYLRKSSVAAQEHGGITQHIGAFIVKMSSGKPITFLDTPGHAAFLTMRQRGANVTDIVVLVVAADDSVKPQTLEALKHAQAANVPIIVAINKIDKEEARIDQVKADLSRHGVEIEDYGGDVQVVCVSGKTGKGMDDLEENIVTLSEMLDVRSESDGMAEGWVLESSVKQNGKVATVLVKRGTLRPGDLIVAGKTWARIRVLRNEAGADLAEAPPGTPVEILGWRDLPEAGEQVLQAPDEDKAKTATEYRQEMAERQQSSVYQAEQEQKQREKEAAEAAQAEAEAAGEEAVEAPSQPGVIYQNYTVKADVAGSVEAVCGTIMELGNNEVQAKILRSAASQISEYDVDHAAISNSIIVNFNLAIPPHIKARAEEAGVRILDRSVIYHVIDDVRDTLSDLLPPSISHRVLGEADVLQIFPINIKKRVYKNIAGCRIRNGAIKRTSKVKVLRRGKVVFDGECYPFYPQL
jgi:translation initiation factor IF-2